VSVLISQRRSSQIYRLVLAFLVCGPAFVARDSSAELEKPAPASSPPLLIAHRGASAYAPEHTLASYRLAIDLGADFVEQDLQVTRDGVLICMHDPELTRTTDVKDVFPNKAASRNPEEQGKPKRGWYTVDFSLEEIKKLDAGSWFNRANPFAAKPEYAGARIATLQEVISDVRDRAGLYIEIKHYEFYKSLGYDVIDKLVSILNANGFNSSGRRDHIFIQSFSKASLLKIRAAAPQYARIQLLPMEDRGRTQDTSKVSASLAREVALYAKGVGPAKQMIRSAADVETFHSAGLLVHPYTFRGPTTAVNRRPLGETQAGGLTLRQLIVADIDSYLTFGVDGGFTDYTDLWVQAVKAR